MSGLVLDNGYLTIDYGNTSKSLSSHFKEGGNNLFLWSERLYSGQFVSVNRFKKGGGWYFLPPNLKEG